MSEQIQESVAARYWTVYQGWPVPQWLEDLVGIDVLEIYDDRYGVRRRFEYWWCLPCAIELVHREKPITSRRQLRRVAAQLCNGQFDFAPALALAEQVTAVRWERYLDAARRSEAWNAEALRRQIEALPSSVQLKKELDAKRLPSDPPANLALMRSIVGLDKMPERG